MDCDDPERFVRGGDVPLNRRRPRLNITLDPAVKQKLERKAEALSVSRSRLIEALIREYLEISRDDPRLDMKVRRAILEHKGSSGSDAGDEEDQREQIEAILRQMDGD